jgi:hypothetical protein
MEFSKDWRFYARYIGLGLITAGAISHIWKGYNYNVLSLYILGACLFIGGLIRKNG